MKTIASFLALLALATVPLSSENAFAADKVVVVPLVKKCTSPHDNSYTNSVGMTFNLIPAGTFIMGSPPAEPGRGPGEDQHQVTLTKAFYMQTTEVTNKQWNDVVVATNNGVNPTSFHTGDRYPVENVNWFEAAVFADLLSVREGLSICYNGNGTCTGTVGVDFTCSSVIIDPNCTGYRLPTEAEWEYAARAGTTTAYANPVWFDTSPDGLTTFTEFNSNLDPMGWYVYNNAITAYANGTKPVALKQANRWGLYDMHGNVTEWCQDWLTGYSSDPVIDPTGLETGVNRIVRGGECISTALFARSAKQYNYTPDTRRNYQGFRLVLPQGR